SRPGDLALLEAVASGERSDWLLLSGPPGSGKSHLLLAACAQAEGRGRQARYLPLKGSVGQVAALLDGAEQAQLLALDDVDAALGRREDELALFALHNRARAAGCVLIYAAAAPAAALPVQLP